MNKKITKAWQQYEAGKEYKRKINLYENIRRNERFYRGDQWYDSSGMNLPKPVFNVIRRIVDYLICSIASGNTAVTYSDENLPFVEDEGVKAIIKESVGNMTANAAYRWEKCNMDKLIYNLLYDAAISGDGVLYCYWNSDIKTGQSFEGDMVTETVDSVNLFLSDVNSPDIQSQDYIILSGRATVKSLKAEARAFGADERDISLITPDDECKLVQSSEFGAYELEGDDESKATYLIKFWRENGKVVFEKSTRSCVIRRTSTDCQLYPVAMFNWSPTKNSFHGTSPISAMIPNQRFINRAYGMVMKHMTDTAFSKVVYDKSKIPEWSNEVGEAIAAVGGTNVSDAVSVVGVGKMQDGYLELIENAMSNTKELMGATDTALGNIIPHNTSAILAIQEASRIPLQHIRTQLYQCIEDMANIWADMMCAYYPNERLLPYKLNGETVTASVDFNMLRNSLLKAHIDVGEITKYSAATTQELLDRLLDKGYINVKQYLERIPTGVLINRESLINELSETEIKTEEERENA